MLRFMTLKCTLKSCINGGILPHPRPRSAILDLVVAELWQQYSKGWAKSSNALIKPLTSTRISAPKLS